MQSADDVLHTSEKISSLLDSQGVDLYAELEGLVRGLDAAGLRI